VLCRSNFVMLCFSKNAKLPKLFIKLLHISRNSWLNYAEVMVLKLLTLRRSCTEKCPSAVDKVFTLLIHFLINEEVFLLRANCCNNSLSLCVAEKFKNSKSLCIDSLHRTEKRSFLIKNLTCV